MPKYTFERNSIVAEAWTVEAPDEDTARDLVSDGHVESKVVEFIDWASDEYELVNVEDELVTFLNSKSVDNLAA